MAASTFYLDHWVALLLSLIFSYLSLKLYRLINHRRKYKSLPTPPHSLVLGNLAIMGEEMKRYPADIHPQIAFTNIGLRYDLEGLYYMDLAPFSAPMIFITDSALGQHIQTSKQFHRHPFSKDFLRGIVGKKSLFSTEGAEWRKQRFWFASAFSMQHILTLVPGMVEEIFVFKQQLERLSDTGEIFRMSELTTKLTIDVIGRSVGDIKLGSQLANRLHIPTSISVTIRRLLTIMSSFEETVRKACDAKEIPGVVLMAADGQGAFHYSKAFGPATPTTPMTLDSTFILASCTKLMTSISAMQCVERGLITLDEDISTHLPELKEVQILTGFNETTKQLEFKHSEKAITLRHLLSHSSGMAYDGLSPLYAKWRESRDETPDNKGSMMTRISVPLLFEPGTSWSYGVNTDWAGVLISRLNNCTLEEYMDKNIWQPLGMKNVTFHQEKKPEVQNNLVKMSTRKGFPKSIMASPVHTTEPVKWTDELLFEVPIVDEHGGNGVITSAAEYMKVLISITADDGKLLKSPTIDEMFRPQLSEFSHKPFQEFSDLQIWDGAFSFVPIGTKQNHGLGGLLVSEDVPTGRKTGTMSWSGLTNLCWSIDREACLCCFYASNLMPFGDYKSGEIQRLFEKEMYARAAQAKA